LVELGWREQYGINIAYIKRGDILINVPGRNNKLMPFDHVGIIATDDQIQSFKPVFDSTESVSPQHIEVEDISLQKILVDEHTKLKGKNIRTSALRERTNGLVVGIQRGTERILNPDSNTVLQWGDIVWIVGDKKKIHDLNKGK
jgi:CPA2 family monovalent cation:H+ antiporter-2